MDDDLKGIYRPSSAPSQRVVDAALYLRHGIPPPPPPAPKVLLAPPTGRRRGLHFVDLAREIRRVLPPEKLVAWYMTVLRGDLVLTAKGEEVEPTIKERLIAAEWLADRGYGKAVQPVELTGEGGDALRVIIQTIGPGGETPTLAAQEAKQEEESDVE